VDIFVDTVRLDLCDARVATECDILRHLSSAHLLCAGAELPFLVRRSPQVTHFPQEMSSEQFSEHLFAVCAAPRVLMR
jgi:hypothetical protein